MHAVLTPDQTRTPAPRVAPGLVTLAGAGPGDPEMLTMRAWRAVREARLVLVDQLVGEDILALIRPDAVCIDVGKHAGHHTVPQAGIIEQMIALARTGQPVLRLKGGDPYIFGRGGEEAQALAAAGVPFEVIPGISAAQGAGALAGIPLTHRDHAQTLVLATGHLRADGTGQGLDWQGLARPHQTVVFYMGLGALDEICRQLQAHGRAPDTPAAVIENIARPAMRTVVGRLSDLPARAAQAAVRPPALVVVGEVVSLHAELAPLVPNAASLLESFRLA